MNSTLFGTIVFASVGMGALAGAVAVALGSTRGAVEVQPDPGIELAVSGLRTEIGDLGQRISELKVRFDRADRIEIDSDARSAARTGSPGEGGGSNEPSDAPPTGTPASGNATDLVKRLDALIRSGMRAGDLSSLLAEVRKSGLEDELIAALRDRIARDPSDPGSQYLLAKACYARLMRESTPAGYEKWGELTVAAWDRAIALDPNYWEARFDRAAYFTYFPESEGKTPELIEELEALIELQAGSSANPAYAETYAHLARMYLRLGKKSQAIQTVSAGVALFPEDVQLQKLLDALSHD